MRLRNRIDSLHRRLLRRMLLAGVRLPRYTVRLRLTLMYGCVFLVCGAGLLAVTYLLVSGSGSSVLYVKSARGVGVIATEAASPERVEGGGSEAGAGEGSEAGGGPEPQPTRTCTCICPTARRSTPRRSSWKNCTSTAKR